MYKFFPKNNYEDFSSGRVILHKPKNPNFPVRLAGEIFCQCLEYINKTKNLCVYDPCCGSAYLLTVLGFLFNEKIETVYGSDIEKESVDFAQNNLSLLSIEGLEKRKDDLMDLIKKYNKRSHIIALNSLGNISKYIKHEIKTNTFIADILSGDVLKNKNFYADIVITDVPYDNLVTWSDKTNGQMNILLNTVIPIINGNAIIVIIHDKDQRIDNSKYHRINKFKVGHRIIEIMKVK
jgi:SAM-dependent methyltransferase